MSKLKRLLPYAAALMIAALCFSGMRAARFILPDYKNQTDEIDLSNSSPVFSLTNDSSPVFPWNLYDGGEIYSSEKNQYFEYRDEIIWTLINDLSPELNDYCKFVAEPTLEHADYQQDGLTLSYIKDLELTDSSGNNYKVNIALDDYYLLYYSFEKQSEAPDYAQVKAGYESLKNAYTSFNGVAKEILVYSDGDDEGDGVQTEYDDLDDNLFSSFIIRVSKVDAETEYTGLIPVCEEIADLIIYGQTSGVKYNGTQMTMDFFYNESALTLFYDPVKHEITGFSFQPYYFNK